MLADLSEVRQSGFALDDQMVTPGIRCLAAPVFWSDGSPAGAIGVAFLAAQHSGAGVSGLAETVRGASARLSALLGWRSVDAATEAGARVSAVRTLVAPVRAMLILFTILLLWTPLGKQA